MVEPGRGTRLAQGPQPQLVAFVVGQPGGGTTSLIATSRCNSSSRASQTRPMPPRPTRFNRRYRPAITTCAPFSSPSAEVHHSQWIGTDLSVVWSGSTQHAAPSSASRLPSGMLIRSSTAGQQHRRPPGLEAAVFAAGGGVAAHGTVRRWPPSRTARRPWCGPGGPPGGRRPRRRAAGRPRRRAPSGSLCGKVTPVTPGSTISASPPVLATASGAPAAAASRATMPNGS